MLGSGNGFLQCSDGRVRWGLHGAAGVLFAIFESDGARVMLQLRSPFAHEGGTWTCAGGAIDKGEDPLEGALRESDEEVGEVPAERWVLGTFVFEPATDWSYTTNVVQVNERFGSSLNFETSAVEWVTLDEVEALPLHPGFAAAWPELRAIVEAAQARRPQN